MSVSLWCAVILSAVVVGQSVCVAQPLATSTTLPAELPALTVVSENEVNGRKVVLYEHDSMETWGYQAPQRDCFYLVPPKEPAQNAPLCVVLHSAGGNAYEEIPVICDPPDRNFYGDATFYVLCLDCARNKNDWWWGNEEIARHPDLYRDTPCPTEKRVMATVEWAIRKFGIDRNRVYLNGISMGGSGSLGIGFVRGDVFAVVSVVVPAGVKHFDFRTAGREFPDPPPLIDLSSQVDGWSKDQEDVLKFCADHRYALVFAWGPFGHTSNARAENVRDGANPAAYEYPWFSIRKNEAYPVFTHATTDSQYPGHKNTTDPDQTGQINAYFRWKNVQDTPKNFVMELRLIRKDELRRPVDTPREATADITPMRLQNFVVGKGAEYTWSVTRAEKVVQSGQATADAQGVLTVPAVALSETPSRLTIEPRAQTAEQPAP